LETMARHSAAGNFSCASAFSQRGRQMGKLRGCPYLFAKMTLQATRSGSNLRVILTARDAEVGHQSGRREQSLPNGLRRVRAPRT